MTWEYLALTAYLVVLAVITWRSARSTDDAFLRASNDVGWKQLAVSFFSSAFSSYNVTVTLTFAYLYGPYVILIFLGVLAAFYAIYHVATKADLNKDVTNIIDIATQRYDNRVATLLHLVLVAILALFITLQLHVNTAIFQALIGWSTYTSALTVGLIVTAYITIGGLNAEIQTDVFQGILLITVGGLALTADTQALTANAASSMLTDTAALKAAVSLGVVQLLTFLIQPEMWQRVVAAKNTDHMRTGMITGWLLLLIVIIPVTVIGMAANAGGAAQPGNDLFISIVEQTAPTWYTPVLLVALFAAFMSTLDSSLFALSTQLGTYGLTVSSDDKNTAHGFTVKQRVQTITVTATAACLLASLFLTSFLQGVFDLISMMTVIATALTASLLLNLSSNKVLVALTVGIATYIACYATGVITTAAVTTLYPSIITAAYILAQEATTKAATWLQKG